MKWIVKVILFVLICCVGGSMLYYSKDFNSKSVKQTSSKAIADHRKKIISMDIYNSKEDMVSNLGRSTYQEFETIKSEKEVQEFKCEGFYGARELFKIESKESKKIDLNLKINITKGKLKYILVDEKKIITEIIEVSKKSNDKECVIEVEIEKGANSIYVLGENACGEYKMEI